ncbi:MAG: sugar phosphate nucleotidyltransferase [bacterium]
MAIAGIILAAGQSKRMKSDKVKVLHNLYGRPILSYTIEAVKGSGVEKIFIVVGYQAERVIERFQDSNITFVIQNERLGTAHAVEQTRSYLSNFKGDIIVLCGDTPLIQSETLKELCRRHREAKAAITLLTAIINNPAGYGRILRNQDGTLEAIIEDKDTTSDQRQIKEINAGIYCFNNKVLFDLLPQIGCNNKQREYYLTDIIFLAKKRKYRLESYLLPDFNETRGINTQAELIQVERVLKERVDCFNRISP